MATRHNSMGGVTHSDDKLKMADSFMSIHWHLDPKFYLIIKMNKWQSTYRSSLGSSQTVSTRVTLPTDEMLNVNWWQNYQLIYQIIFCFKKEKPWKNGILTGGPAGPTAPLGPGSPLPPWGPEGPVAPAAPTSPCLCKQKRIDQLHIKDISRQPILLLVEGGKQTMWHYIAKRMFV